MKWASKVVLCTSRYLADHVSKEKRSRLVILGGFGTERGNSLHFLKTIKQHKMGLYLKKESPTNGFEAIDLLVKKESSLSDALHLLESIMLNSDIDNNKESGGLTTWKKKIMVELMKHGYKWDGDAHEANLLFGESYGVDWA